MDHKYIIEVDLVERYLMGRLAAEETAEFEEHFVDCLTCVDQLNTTKAIMDGLRIVASDRPPASRSRRPKRLAWWLPTRSRRSLALAAVVLLLVAVGGAVVVANKIRRSQAEANHARSASAEFERLYEEERKSSALAEMKSQDAERDLKRQLAQSQVQLENEHKRNSDAIAANDRGALKPQINVAIFVLKATRGTETPTGAVNELVVPRSRASFVISVPLEGEGGNKTYAITILHNNQKQLIWKGTGLKPDRYNWLSIGFESTFFSVGDYNLTVERVALDGSTSSVGIYSFRVLKSQ